MQHLKIILLSLIAISLSACDGWQEAAKEAANDVVKDVVTSPAMADEKAKPNIAQFYERLPDIGSCAAGELKQAEKLKVLAELNKIRQLHKLPAVDYEYNDDVYTAKSALISVANSALNHHPTADFKCYSQDGEHGSSTSNLQIYWLWGLNKPPASTDAISSWLIDNKVESLGHRRWLLDPFLKTVSFGRADGKPLVKSKYPYVSAMSIKVINSEKAQPENLAIDFVAYPFADYPSKYFNNGWYMSFAVVTADKSAAVDFSKATISISDNSAQQFIIKNIKYDNRGYGLDNNLQWQAQGIETGKKYNVNISNVKISGVTEPQSYQYYFKLI